MPTPKDVIVITITVTVYNQANMTKKRNDDVLRWNVLNVTAHLKYRKVIDTDIIRQNTCK